MKEEKIQHHHQYQGADMTDLRQFFTTAPTHNFQPPPTAQQTLFSSAFAPLTQNYDVSMMLAMGAHALPGGGGSNINVHGFRSTPTPTNTSPGPFDVEAVGGGDGGATARWPRQETLTLLEIRSRLDHKFKEANHKGPLWDELSRIMCVEHGYQRSGKKCREKFENLYKYYKKTRGGKAGRHDGKSYRFFRQLEALYGETSHTTTTSTNHLHMIDGTNNINTTHIATNEGQCNIVGNQDGFQSVSLSNYSPSDFDYTTSSEGEKEGSTEQGESSMDVMVRSRRSKRGRMRSWKENVKEFIDSQMGKMMEKQEAWLESMVRTLEHKERERVSREEEWRRQETQRMEREHMIWAEERAWIEARDKALIDALHRIITSKEVVVVEKNLSCDDHSCHDHQKQQHSQEEEEEEEEEESELEIALEKANNNTDYCSKKRKVNCNIQSSDHDFSNNLYKYGEMNSQGGMGLGPQEKALGEGGNTINESCLRMLLGDGGNQKPSMGSQLWS